MNITDVDDKTIKRSINDGIPLKDLTTHYEQRFFEDLEWLKIAKADFYPRATDSISKIVEMISTLISKKLCLCRKGWIVYFKIKNFKKYGELSGCLLTIQQNPLECSTTNMIKTHSRFCIMEKL